MYMLSAHRINAFNEEHSRLVMENQRLLEQVYRLQTKQQQLQTTVTECARRLKAVKDAWARLPESATGGIRASQW